MIFVTHRTQRSRMIAGIFALCMLCCATGVTLRAQTMATYFFSESTGTPTNMASAATIFGAGTDDGVAGPYNIGFTFVLDGVSYTQFSASSNGYIGLGTPNVSSYLSGSFSGTNLGRPIVAGMWRDLHMGSDGFVRYATTGNVGSRILTVEWRMRDYPGSGQPTNSQMQVRLYEGSNRIDMWYGPIVSNGGTMGVQISTSNYASISPGPPATVSYSISNNAARAPSDVNKVYSFDMCTISITGNIAEGGNATMNNNDSLLLGKEVRRGSSGGFKPFTVRPTGCLPSAAMTYTIGGPNAADFAITPGNEAITSGNTSSPTITFTPSATGMRYATLAISGPSGFSRNYILAAKGLPRLVYTGNVAEGGTVDMKNGDTLLKNISIRRGTTIDVRPFSLTNIATQGDNAPATYTLAGTSGGQYSLSTGSTSIAPQGSHVPVITFEARGIGVILDTLRVNADGEVRSFPLLAFSEAPGVQISLNGDVVDSGDQFFRDMYSCIGSSYVTYTMQVTNIGASILEMYEPVVYMTDTAYQQGQPRYPLLTETVGQEEQFVIIKDYIVTDQPPVLPITSPQNTATYPVQVGRGQTKTLYFSFNANRIDKRFGRVYIRTNGENVFNMDPYGENTMGLVWFDVFGRGIGGRLSENGTETPIKGVTFPATRLRESSTAEFTFYNSGKCDIHISLPDLRLSSGDVDEFEIVTMPSKRIVGDDLVLSPGESDVLVARFTPLQQGSRRASIRVKTNDSMMEVPGVTERGVYYVDLYGVGRTGLYIQGHNFGKALIGGDENEHKKGVIRLENNQATPIVIQKIELVGTDLTEFMEDAAHPWPTPLPYTVEPGAAIEMGVTFAPVAGGQPGPREAALQITTADGEVITATLTGEAATRTIMVTPMTVNFNVSTGKATRKMVMVTNNGTMPLKLEQPVLPAGTDFSATELSRLVLAPGQTEMVEVTFTPQGPGTSTATLSFESNATNGKQDVALNGAARTREKGDPDPSSVTSGTDNGIVLGASEGLSVSAVEGATVGGFSLLQSMPNPGRDVVEIGYILPQRGEITLALYDAEGNLVRTLDESTRDAGLHRVRVAVGDLASGTYHYRLMAGGRMLSRTLTIVK